MGEPEPRGESAPVPLTSQSLGARWLDETRRRLRSVERWEERFHRRANGLFGLRIIELLGWTRIVRVFAAVVWAMCLLQVVVVFRADLLHPGDIGSDSSNYVAAAERLTAGHRIYELEPGDRPVPLDNAPDWTVPLLSPPTVPMALAWTTALPDAVRTYPLWLVGLAGTVALGWYSIAIAPAWLLFFIVYYLPGLAITAFSGNLNAIVGPAFVLAFHSLRSGRRSLEIAAGVLIGLAMVVKLGPVILGIWLVAQNRVHASVAMIWTTIAIALGTIALGGIDDFARYVGVVRDAAAMPTALSVPGLARNLGVSGPAASLLLPILLIVLAAVIVRIRRTRFAFLAALIGSIFATAVVRYESLSMIAAGATPWAYPSSSNADTNDGHGPSSRLRLPIGRLAALAGIGSAGAALAVSIATGGMTRSSLAVANQSDRPIVVRFAVVAQDASFGFSVPPGSAIAGWSDVAGGAAPLMTVFSADCEPLFAVPLPPEGGAVRVTRSTAVVLAAGSIHAAPAPYSPACAGQFKARRIAQERSSQSGPVPSSTESDASLLQDSPPSPPSR